MIPLNMQAQIEAARGILASRSAAEWQKPEHQAEYEYLTKHVIPEAERYLRWLADHKGHAEEFEAYCRRAVEEYDRRHPEAREFRRKLLEEHYRRHPDERPKAGG